MTSASAKSVMKPAWLVIWALWMSLAWLLPNHFRPWTTFHADAWMAAATLLCASAVAWRGRSHIIWHGLPVLAAALVLLPWIQLGLGMIDFFGQAWMSSLYLFGFMLALLTGAQWERASPGQWYRAFFLAVGCAGLISVWLQLYAFLALGGGDVTDIWSMGLSGNRPYANLGQPNQLATLLLWALIACLWAYVTGRIGGGVTLFAACFFLYGLSLTQSRMGLLALTVVLVVLWWWRRLWPTRGLPVVGLLLYGVYWLCPLITRWLLDTLLQGGGAAAYIRLAQQGELRLVAWKLFIHAAVERPWFGYGWTDLSKVQLRVADSVPALGIVFDQSHNLFLDLILWCGVPLGVLIGFELLRWFWLRLRRINRPEDAVAYLTLLVVGIHAMLELPLHHAYFLLPVGMTMGALATRSGDGGMLTTRRWTFGLLCLIAGVGLSVTVSDYLKIESSFNTLRFEQARIGVGVHPPGRAPDVIVLTSLREWIRLGRYPMKAGMTEQDLDWARKVIQAHPSAMGVFQLARALAVNGKPDEARTWLIKACRITSSADCRDMRFAWLHLGTTNADIAAVRWPVPLEPDTAPSDSG